LLINRQKDELVSHRNMLTKTTENAKIRHLLC